VPHTRRSCAAAGTEALPGSLPPAMRASVPRSPERAIPQLGQHRRIAALRAEWLPPAPTTGPRDLVEHILQLRCIWSRALCMGWRCGLGISPHCCRWLMPQAGTTLGAGLFPHHFRYRS
jgi:hypothetical protein